MCAFTYKDPYHTQRTYRIIHNRSNLKKYEVKLFESDLHIQTEDDLKDEIFYKLLEARIILSDYISRRKEFLTSLSPIEADPDAPELIKMMIDSARQAGVGPMASVAGAIAQYIGQYIKNFTKGDIIIENGGDIYAKVSGKFTFVLYAGNSILSSKIAVEIPDKYHELGICTSSGTVGHSLSFGNADAVTIISHSASLADAYATFFGNMVKSPKDVKDALELAKNKRDILGAIIIIGSTIGAFGDIKLLPADIQYV